MKRLILTVTGLLIIGLMSLQAASSSLNVRFGMFTPRMDSDLWDINMENLALDDQDMQDTFSAVEYEYFLNSLLSFSMQGGFYNQEHYTAYRDYEYDDGSPINQNLYLKINSLELNFKFYPLGHRRLFSPYAGGGIGIYHWRYEQWGDFINFEDGSVQEGYAYSKGYTPGFNARVGCLLKVSRILGFSFETRYQFVKGRLSSLFEGFEKFDLSGISYDFGLHIFL